jgi:DedD protein
MAWFNFGKKDIGMGTKASVQKPVETVDAMRQRAKYRLIGAVVLVLAGVVGFPMLFDSQPRPVAVDIPIEIPDKAKVRPLGAPSVTSAPSAPAVAAKVDDSASLSGKEEIVSTSKPDAKSADKKPAASPNNAQAASKAVAAGAAVAAAGAVAAGALKNTDKAAEDAAKAAAAGDKATADKGAADKAVADKVAADKARKLAEEDKAKKLKAQIAEKAAADKVAEASRAKALLDDTGAPLKPAPTAAVAAATAPAADGATRYIVQFGAFSDADKAQEARRKVEKVGLKTYSQIAKTPDGDRIRVRVGPFTNKDEADKAAAKIKSLDLPASILTL